MLRKPRAYAEVYNDLDGEIVNLFRVVREHGEQLAKSCELTPFSRDEFFRAYDDSDDPVERARRTLVRSFMGFGSAGVTKQVTGFRANTSRSWSTPAHNWQKHPVAIRQAIERLRGVVIENRDALECMRAHDGADTLHYVDPPYVLTTRHFREWSPSYRHEMRESDHVQLAEGLRRLRGTVLVSGYRCDLYDRLFAGWRRVDRAAQADGARDRIESMWMSPTARRVTTRVAEAIAS